MKRGTHTSKGGNPQIFFDIEFCKSSCSRALAPACGTVVGIIFEGEDVLITEEMQYLWFESTAQCNFHLSTMYLIITLIVEVKM